MKSMIIISSIFFSLHANAFITDIGGVKYSCEPINEPNEPPAKVYYCTIKSTFDGSFGGSGRTQLEAEQAAEDACREGSRSNGWFCEDSTMNCDSN